MRRAKGVLSFSYEKHLDVLKGEIDEEKEEKKRVFHEMFQPKKSFRK